MRSTSRGTVCRIGGAFDALVVIGHSGCEAYLYAYQECMQDLDDDLLETGRRVVYQLRRLIDCTKERDYLACVQYKDEKQTRDARCGPAYGACITARNDPAGSCEPGYCIYDSHALPFCYQTRVALDGTAVAGPCDRCRETCQNDCTCYGATTTTTLPCAFSNLCWGPPGDTNPCGVCGTWVDPGCYWTRTDTFCGIPPNSANAWICATPDRLAACLAGDCTQCGGG